MKHALVLLLVLAQTALSTELRLTTVTQPLYLFGGDEDPQIQLQAVPYITAQADPEWRFTAIAAPCFPPGSVREKRDVNLASVYQITVSGTFAENGKDMVVTVDASKAKPPEGYPFTVEQVIDAVTTCIKIMYPPRPAEEGALKIEVKRAGAKAAGQE